jgi:hypothetical protein
MLQGYYCNQLLLLLLDRWIDREIDRDIERERQIEKER